MDLDLGPKLKLNMKFQGEISGKAYHTYSVGPSACHAAVGKRPETFSSLERPESRGSSGGRDADRHGSERVLFRDFEG